MRKSAITKRVAAKIAELRARRGKSQAVVAAEAGVNRVTLARLELGLHEPSLGTLERIARALGVTLRVELVERQKGGRHGR